MKSMKNNSMKMIKIMD